MNEIYEFTKVNNFNNDTIKHITSFNTDTGKTIEIQDDELGKLNIQFVHRAMDDNRIIFVAYDPVTGMCHFATSFDKDYVKNVELIEKPQTSLKVTLVRLPSFLFLLPTHPHFEALRKILENAKGKDQLIWVGIFPGDSEILEVRLPSL